MTEGIERSYPAKSAVIASHMHHHALSIRSLAEKANLSQQTIRRLLKGESASMESFNRIASALEVPAIDLFESTHTSERTELRSADDLTAVIKFPQHKKDADTNAAAYELLKTIADRIQQKGIVVIIATDVGSIIASLFFTHEDDIQGLVRAFCSRELGDLHIDFLQVPAHINIDQAILEGLSLICPPSDLAALQRNRLQGSVPILSKRDPKSMFPPRTEFILTIHKHPKASELKWKHADALGIAAAHGP